MSLQVRLAATLLTLLLMSGIYFLLANSHIDVFPCQVWEYDVVMQSYRNLPLEQMCSLLDKSRSGVMGEDRVELTFFGHVMAVVLVVILPLLVGVLMAQILAKKSCSQKNGAPTQGSASTS